MTLKRLLHLCVISDKYDTVRMLRPWSGKWIDPLKSEDSEDPTPWLFISWTLGDQARYRAVSLQLVKTISIATDGRAIRRGIFLEQSGPLPPGAIGPCLTAPYLDISS